MLLALGLSACSSGNIELNGGHSPKTPITSGVEGIAPVSLPVEELLKEGFNLYAGKSSNGLSHFTETILLKNELDNRQLQVIRHFSLDQGSCSYLTKSTVSYDDCDSTRSKCLILEFQKLDSSEGSAQNIECQTLSKAPLTLTMVASSNPSLTLRSGELLGHLAQVTVNVSSAWQPIAQEDAPPPLLNYQSHKTDSEILILGKDAQSKDYVGSAYDLVKNSWRRVQNGNLKTLEGPIASVWTGTELFIWSNKSAGFLDPVSLAFSSLKWETDLTFSEAYNQKGLKASLGRDGLLILGYVEDETRGKKLRGLYYNIQDHSFRTIDGPATAVGPITSIFWTGVEFVIWSGFDHSRWFYYPESNTWRKFDAVSTDQHLNGELVTPLWTGSKLVMLSLEPANLGKPRHISSAWLSDPQGNPILPLNTGDFALSQDKQIHWTGNWIISWTGQRSANSHDTIGDGYCFNPQNNATLLIPHMEGAPSYRTQGVQVWTNEHLFIWGGCARETDGLCDAYVKDGATIRIQLSAEN